MKGLGLAALVVLVGCAKTPTVWVAPHATAERPTFVIRDGGGGARHLDVVPCGDTARPVWEADARPNDTLPSVLVDSTTVLDGDCYFVRIVPGNRRHFWIKPNHFIVQDVP